jgi:hypothetical protein
MRTMRLAAFLGVALVLGAVIGKTYVPRLPNHAGYWLVPVADEVRAPIATRPRHTVFIVVDGLRRDAAEGMASAQALAKRGQCRESDQGGYTVSRPEYALLSTGLEVDRHGSRNNDLTAPLAAESIWEIAREAGLRVTGRSHLPWFAQLFPRGFDSFTVLKSHAEDVFAAPELADVNVFHPLYVDEAGHRHGGASPEYASAVARADREINGLLARLDLEQDLVVLTADHGHRDEGGHGGAQPEIRHVLLCFAGRNVAPNTNLNTNLSPIDGRSTAPALALLLGLRFPRHMRAGPAGEDGLDAIFDVARADALGTAYLEDRRAAVERFRSENEATLTKWLGGPPGTWSRLYARENAARELRLAVAALVLAAFVALRVRATRRGRHLGEPFAFLAATALTLYGAHRAVLGAFDYTVINREGRFIGLALLTVGLSAAVSFGGHAVIVRDRARLVADGATAVGALLLALLLHVAVYGWPLGFPLPPSELRYAPFFGAIALVGYAATTLAVLLVRSVRRTARGRARRWRGR